MGRQVVTAVVLSLGLGCTGATSAKPTAEQRRAYEALRTTAGVDSAHIGAIGNLSYSARAFRVLLEADDAAERFAALAEQAALGGRLIALCGLKLKAPARYPAALASLQAEDGGVGGMQGCIVGLSRSVADVLADIDHGALCDDYAGTNESESIRAHYRAEGFPPM
jgi:hypothetical protein